MKFFIVLSAVAAVALARPGHLLVEPSHHVTHAASPLIYSAPHVHVKLVPGAPIGHDGRVVDTPEVAHAKAEHEAAHINEKHTLAHEAAKSADHYSYAAAPALIATSYHSNAYASLPVASYHDVHHHGGYHAVAPIIHAKLVHAAPLGHDGRVIDTPEVAHAKAEHVAAHVNEKITLAHEEAKSGHWVEPAVHHAYSSVAYAPQHYSSHHSAAPLVSVW